MSEANPVQQSETGVTNGQTNGSAQSQDSGRTEQAQTATSIQTAPTTHGSGGGGGPTTAGSATSGRGQQQPADASANKGATGGVVDSGSSKPMTPLDGKATLDAKFASVEIAAFTHHAVERIADAVARALAAGPARTSGSPPSYVLAKSDDLQVLFAYRAFQVQLRELRTELRALEDQLTNSPVRATEDHDSGPAKEMLRVSPAALAPAAVDAVTQTMKGATIAVDAVLNLVALFRTDVTLSGRDVPVDDVLFMSELRARLPDDVRLFMPALAPAGLGRHGRRHDVVAQLSGHLTELRRLEDGIADALPPDTAQDDRAIAAVRAAFAALIGQRQKLEAALFGTTTPAPAAAAGSATGGKAIDAARGGDGAANAGGSSTAASGASSGTSGSDATFRTIVRGAALDALIADGSHLLMVQVQASGGATRVEGNRFWGRPRVSANGGAVISVLVFDGDGALVMGRTLSAVESYRRLATADSYAPALHVGTFFVGPHHGREARGRGSTR